ncbi:MAG: helix-turn-helix domain-containing protein [Agathobaculum desmolans]|uniref:helix-turn-helix domain-containing protein n=1 Tax=Agathobaculum desmolans TaxID=39484 RepID=UPI00068D615C|nr:helix-turn-helix transcriptional regulator [Agathobaculum desmolans]
MTFGEKLKTLRIREEYSQEALAELLHVSRQAVTKWENNAGMPDIENIKAVADLFDVTLDSLLRDEEEVETTEESRGWKVAAACAAIGMVIGLLLDELGVGSGRMAGMFTFGAGVTGGALYYIALQLRKINKR